MWNEALQSKDPKAVANLYSTGDLSFLPTVSPQHVRDSMGTEEYFIAFVAKDPFGTITDDSVQVFEGGEAYLHTGMYTFALGPKDDRTNVEARFSYMWKKMKGEWKITHHHSSVVPPKAVPSQADMLSLAQTNFQKWNDALQTKNPKTVANFYNEKELSFLPTVSPTHIKDNSGTEGYFEAFVKKNPFGTVTDESVQTYSNGSAYLHSGITIPLPESQSLTLTQH